MRYDLVIIGGAVAGSPAAIRLARAGWNVLVIERDAFPRRKVCGEYLSPTNEPVLRALGLGDWFHEVAGPPVGRLALFARDQVIEAPVPTGIRGSGARQLVADGGPGPRLCGRALGRDLLDAELARTARAAGAGWWQPAKVTGMQKIGEGWRLQVRVGAGAAGHPATSTSRAGVVEVDTALLLAAHGSWGRGLPTMPTPREARANDLFGFKAHFFGGNLAPALMPALAFDGGYGGMVITDGGRISLSCCVRRDELERMRARHPAAQPGDSVVAALRSRLRGVREALQGTEPDGRVMAAGPIRPAIRGGWRDDVFATGNAAGEAHPIIAEGISMALQSSWMAAGQLLDGGGGDPLAAAADRQVIGRRYDRAWRRAFAPRIRAAAVFARLAMSPRLVAALTPCYLRWPALLTWNARLAGKARVVVVPAPVAGGEAPRPGRRPAA